MVNQKVVAGGVAATAIAGGTGVAIHKATSSEEIVVNESLNSKITSETTKLDVNINSESCQKALKVKDNNDENYRKAVLACIKNSTFDAIATHRGLFTFNETNKSDTGWATWWDTAKTDIQKIVKEITNSNSTWDTTVQDHLKTYCKQKSIEESTTSAEWYQYLKACTKDAATTNTTTKRDELLKKGIWTNQPIILSKLTEAGFGTKTDADCTKKLEKDYEETEYKKVLISCANSNDFEKRATELGLYPLTSSSKSDNHWNTWWGTQKDTVKGIVKTITEDDWSTKAKDPLTTYCEENKKITVSTKDEQWHNYLKACVRDNSSAGTATNVTPYQSKTFWHN